MTIFLKEELKKYSKQELIEIIMNIQSGDPIEKLPPKTSENSSIPSSRDITKKETKSENAKKRGPKFGHKGTSRKSVEKPDIIIESKITKCPRTGKEVQSESRSYHKHQIIELIPGTIHIIEIRRQTTTGPDGKTITAPNVKGISDHQKFGPNLKSWVSMLRFKFHMEWDSIKEFFKILFSFSISQGSLNRVFKELRKEFEKEYNGYKEDIKEAKILGIDETGSRIEGKRAWSWIFRTDDTSVYVAADNRSHRVVEETIGNEFNGIVITDFFRAYSEKFFKVGGWQKCLAHLKRDTVFSCEVNDDPLGFSKKLLKIIQDSFILRLEKEFGSTEYLEGSRHIEDRMDELIRDDAICKNHFERKLKKRLVKYRDHLFTFLKDEKVPFDNNGSERDIRKWVIFRKIYGCFRTKESAENLAVIFSIIETCKKRGQDYFKKIQQAFRVNELRESLVPIQNLKR